MNFAKHFTEFCSMVRSNNIPALVQIIFYHRPGEKPLSERMVVSLLTHICTNRLQWVKTIHAYAGIDPRPNQTSIRHSPNRCLFYVDRKVFFIRKFCHGFISLCPWWQTRFLRAGWKKIILCTTYYLLILGLYYYSDLNLSQAFVIQW